MKRISFILAAAFAGFATFSCVKEQNVPTNVLTEKTVHFGIVAEGTDSKTAVLADESDVIWGGQDELTVLEMLEYTTTDGPVSANNWGSASVTNLTDDGKKAEFDASISAGLPDGATLTSATYVAVYPETKDILKQGGSDPNKFWRVSMPDTQNPEVATFDPKADILLSAPAQKSDLSRVADGDKLPFRFHRIGTAAKMTVKGLTAGEKLKSIVITAPVDVAGLVKVDLTNGGYLDGISTPYSGQGKKVLTLRFSDWVISGDVDVWFRVLPGDWEGTLEIVAETDKAYYYRTEDEESAITLSTPMQFIDGGRTRFAVNLGTVRVAKADATEFTIVTEQTDIAENVRYIVAYYDPEIDANTAVVMKPISGSNKYTDVKSDVAVSSSVIAIATGEVQVVTLEKATGDNTGDNDYYVLFGEKYLSCGTSNATLTLNTDKPASNGIWTVTPSGIVNTTATNKNDKAFELQYNNNPARFANYAGTMKAITLFKNNEAVTPVPVNTITLSGLSEGNKLYLDAVGGVASFTLTTDAAWSTNVNIVNGDFSIDPEGDNAAAANQDIEVEAEDDNTGAEREMGTITITCGNATETVHVIQRAGSTKGTLENPYTVAEALAVINGLEDNTNTSEVYVSGIVSQEGSYNSNYHSVTYYISDDGSTDSELQIYSGKYVANTNFNAASQIAINDQVIIYGQLRKYVKDNVTTPEVDKNNYIYSLNGKTKVLTLAEPTISYDQANKKITVAWTAATGSEGTVSYVVTCGTKDYGPVTEGFEHTFGMDDYGTYSVTITASANDAISAFVEVSAILVDPGSNNGDGLTPDTAFNMTGVKAYIESLNGSASAKVYVKGKISQIVNNGTYGATQYGNATFWISDDGSTNEFEAYRVMYLGNLKWEEGDTDIQVGDDVILYGNVTKYNTTYETSSGNAYLYSLNGVKYPTITVSDISGVDAAGVTTTTTVTFADNAGWTASVTPDGTVVTAASISGSTITYTVGANTGSLRTGKITVSLTKGSRTISAEISVSQMSGAGDSGPSDQSANYTGNIILSTEGGTSTSACTINIGETPYDGIKAGTSKIAGAVKVTVPTGAKYLHLHVAAWKGETVTLSVSPSGYSSDIALTSDSGIANNSPFTFSGDPSSTDYYKVITFSDALTADTELTFTATGGKRFVIWGVYAE